MSIHDIGSTEEELSKSLENPTTENNTFLMQIIANVLRCSPRHRLYREEVGGGLRPSRRLRGLVGDALAAEDDGHDDRDGEDEAAEDAREYHQKRHRCCKRVRRQTCYELRSFGGVCRLEDHPI